MTDVLFLSAPETTALITPGALLDAERRALVMISQGTASVPGRGMAHAAGGGMIESMPGYLPGMGYGAKLISFTPGNAARGLPLHFALLTLFAPDTGAPLAVISADALTAQRTAAVTAVATAELARPQARVLAVIGSGVQAAAHLEFVLRVREFTEVRLASRNQASAQALAGQYPQVRLTGARQAVSGADVVCCCTSSAEPVLDVSWLSAGTHVNSVGMGREVDAATAGLARIFVESRAAACAPYPSGALEVEGRVPESLTEVGEVLAGRRPGRTSADELTLFKSVGHAAEDMAAGHVVYAAARAQNAGRMLRL